ncbi:TetR/AcrR family transcriptional regulator [Cytophagales bacterium LB-30]|uniref:TetR/AcrR family transcriptional regulator n=1 Tax=Shiella aurantiaca TaxID=3058365 RepID=A0ABT8F9R2_9BACT|nr:TetR/AcrR family transcriptional regulator [Shiella aurantiaca]MDN4166701.1 TetR/AcrR family transcriptional regulator [Shiella aurantiaca]
MKKVWIENGYLIFSKKGLVGLKIEPLAKIVNKSKSSFYHHFADLEIFTDELLTHHLKKSREIAQKEYKAKNINPELINILIEHKTDIFFNQQLRFNRHIKSFETALLTSNKLVGEAFIAVWLNDLNLKLNMSQIEGIFSIALDNFFLQITEKNYTHKWLTDYFETLKTSIQKLMK